MFFVIFPVEIKIIRWFGSPVRENATYNCPCEKHSVRRSTPTYLNVWILGIRVVGVSAINFSERRYQTRYKKKVKLQVAVNPRPAVPHNIGTIVFNFLWTFMNFFTDKSGTITFSRVSGFSQKKFQPNRSSSFLG